MPTDREELAALWNVPVERIPDARGLAYPDIIEAAVAEEDPRAVDHRDQSARLVSQHRCAASRRCGTLEFLVVQDGFHPTPTTELAHLVLPAAIWGEKEGTYTNSERRVSKVNRGGAAAGRSASDFDIFLGVAQELGCRDELFPGWTNAGDAFDEWKRVSEGRLCDYSGMTYEAIEETGGMQWPFPEGAPDPQRLAPPLRRRRVPDRRRPRAALLPSSGSPFPSSRTREFPFVLNTGRTVEHWHTRTKTGAVPILERLSPRAWLEMNPRDAKQLGLRPHDRVDVVSPRGRVRGVELRVTEIIAPGQVFMPFHFAETNVNEVTQEAFDPISREPNYKQCAVRVEKSSAART